MKPAKISIVHFQPIEKYPPILNLISYLKSLCEFKVQILTTKDRDFVPNILTEDNVQVFRNGLFYTNQNLLERYINYFVFNLFTLGQLIRVSPSSIICFETVSFWPVFVIKKVFPKTKILIHYHEYSSPAEIQKSSPYIKFLNRLEKRMFSKTAWISQTNEDRLEFFRKDYGEILLPRLAVLPNYPPLSWYSKNENRTLPFTTPVKFVYVGALGMDTMYTKQFAEWIQSLEGSATWDIFSSNYQPDVLDYLEKLHCKYIKFRGSVEYHNLPTVLSKYDVGLILYNGHIPNYIYNAPNKLFEYHACKLDVWFSEDIKGCYPFKKETTYPKIIDVNFNRLSNFNFDRAIDRIGLNYSLCKYYAEDVLPQLVCLAR